MKRTFALVFLVIVFLSGCSRILNQAIPEDQATSPDLIINLKIIGSFDIMQRNLGPSANNQSRSYWIAKTNSTDDTIKLMYVDIGTKELVEVSGTDAEQIKEETYLIWNDNTLYGFNTSSFFAADVNGNVFGEFDYPGKMELHIFGNVVSDGESVYFLAGNEPFYADATSLYKVNAQGISLIKQFDTHSAFYRIVSVAGESIIFNKLSVPKNSESDWIGDYLTYDGYKSVHPDSENVAFNLRNNEQMNFDSSFVSYEGYVDMYSETLYVIEEDVIKITDIISGETYEISWSLFSDGYLVSTRLFGIFEDQFLVAVGGGPKLALISKDDFIDSNPAFIDITNNLDYSYASWSGEK